MVRVVVNPFKASLGVSPPILVAMTADDGPSLISDIARRMDVTPQYVNTYRRRLLETDMIFIPSRGKVDFSLPYMREYLREHAAFDGLNALNR